MPPGYRPVGASWWANAFENPVAAQFHHRVLAMLTATVALALLWRVRAAAAELPADAIRGIRVFGAVVLLQAALGIATLLLVVPIVLGVTHQFVGVMALATGVVAAQRVWGAGGTSGARGV